jgi:hypothetical protein
MVIHVKLKKIDVTMKKTYIIPAIQVVEVKTQQFLMMSDLGSTNSTSGNLSREGSFWDDED